LREHHIQQLLKSFTVTSGELCCHAVMIHTDWITHLYFLLCKFTWPTKIQFSLVVIRILNTCVLVFCVVSMFWSVWVNGSFYCF